ncbi:MAG: PP2C family protein-serine/threonine phosphatase [Acidimicrobiales bacterium]
MLTEATEATEPTGEGSTGEVPGGEEERLAAVHRYNILDTPPDGAFDRITAIAARVFSVPIAIVSIVDRDRIWFKSHHGLDIEQIDRDPGLCASAILQPDAWLLPDAARDPRALANPLVAGSFGLRFYAGIPLTTHDGYNLGTLCVIDRSPRQVTAEEMRTLEDLAALVVDELELRLAARTATRQEAELRATMERERDQAARVAYALKPGAVPPESLTVPGLEVATMYRPLDESELGGDFYDAFVLGPGAWAVVVGDVCGKGTSAAALTTFMRHILQAAAVHRRVPSRMLALANESLLLHAAASDDELALCTATLASVRPGPDGAAVTFSSAGNPPPYLLHRGEPPRCLRMSGGMLGAFKDLELDDQTLQLGPGDTLLMLTDGLPDARVGNGTFGELVLDEALAGLSDLPPAELLAALADELVESRATVRDDIALVAITPAPPARQAG